MENLTLCKFWTCKLGATKQGPKRRGAFAKSFRGFARARRASAPRRRRRRRRMVGHDNLVMGSCTGFLGGGGCGSRAPCCSARHLLPAPRREILCMSPCPTDNLLLQIPQTCRSLQRIMASAGASVPEKETHHSPLATPLATRSPCRLPRRK